MTDEGVEFGAVRETTPVTRRRPDQDGRHAAVVCGAVATGDLPIFVELDAWRDMISHACGDTSVELGGVLLGGTHVDEQGHAFVVISDCVRAEHYEATRGSFKFTHETWEAITRRRAEFGAELQMVGWYHTHPDWGVFLSSMDLFICDHFFAKPLDVALVIDPCRGDWGFFQWTPHADGPPRRTGGCYLIAARQRRLELEQLAAVFQPAGGPDMTADPRWTAASQGAPATAPVVHIHQPPGHPAALWAMVLLQTLLLAVVAWRLAAPQAAPSSAPTNQPSDVSVRQWLAVQRAEAKSAAQTDVMNKVLADLAAAPDGTFDQLTDLHQQNADLESSLRAQQARERELVDQQNRLVAKSRRERQELESKLETAGRKQDELQREVASQREELTQVNRRLQSRDPSANSAPGESADLPWYRSPVSLAAGAAAGLAALAVGWWFQQRRVTMPLGPEN